MTARLLFQQPVTGDRSLRGVGVAIYLLSLVLSDIYAVSDEYHQSFVPCRHASVTDVFIDSSGALTLLGSLRIMENQT